MVSRSEFFVDYSLPAGRRYLLGSNVIRDGSTAASFAVMRGPDQLAFDAQSTNELLELMPHLVRAAKIQKRMLCAPRDCADSLSQAALDHLSDGVLITDGAGRTVRLNRAAELMLVREEFVSARQRRIRLTTDHATSQLRALIADAASHAASGQSGGTLLLEAGGLRWVFLVAPLMPRVAIFDLQDQRLALIIVTRLTLPATLERRLRQAFLLTRAEARLAAQLMGGATLDVISEQLGVRLPTLRTQLKIIFRKTDTNRQGELMRLGMLFKPLHDPHDDGV
jgi:DNA-binding CsgD family transcriptional regulator